MARKVSDLSANLFFLITNDCFHSLVNWMSPVSSVIIIPCENVCAFSLPSNQIKSEPKEESNRVDKSNVSIRKTKKPRKVEKHVAADISDLGFEPDEILGANEFNGKLKFRIKVKGSDDWKIVQAKRAHAACPELVMDFYEKHILLDGEPLMRSNWFAEAKTMDHLHW